MGILSGLGLDLYLADTTKPKYTQDFFPVEDIKYGMIITKNKKYIKIVEVKPINFFMKSPEEQNDIIYDFAKWLKIAPVNMQIKILTRNADTDSFIENIKENCDNENKTFDKLFTHYTNLIEHLGSSGIVTRKFYLIIEYEPKNELRKLTNELEIADELNKVTQTIKEYFSKMGNTVMRFSETNDGSSNSENWKIGKFLYELYNPRTSKDGEYNEKVSFKNRVKRISKDKKIVNDDDNIRLDNDILSIIAPTGMTFTESEYCLVDGVYHTFLCISANGYPSRVPPGWINFITQLEVGESVDIFIHRENTRKVLASVAQKIKFTGLKMDDRNESQSDYEQIESALESSRYIKQAISSGEDPFYISTIMTLSAYTYDELMERRDSVIDSLAANSIAVDKCKYLQEEVFKSTGPFLQQSPKLFQKTKRNILTYGLASCYPFTAYEMKDDNGILLGINSYNNSMCILNPFEQRIYKNANMMILGTSGAGKTYTEQLMALRLRLIGTQCFILAPDKGHEFKRASDAIGGSYIKIAPSSTDHINIMDIRHIETSANMTFLGDDPNSIILVSDKTQAIITFFELLIPDITNEEQQVLDSSIIKTYEDYGITKDNDSLYIDLNNKQKGYKKMPILEDLYNNLINTKINKRVPNIMLQFVTGSASSFNHRTNVDLENKYIVFDLGKLKGKLLPAGMFVALDFVWSRIKEDVLERKMVFIDEGWQLIGAGSNKKAAEYVHTIFKEIRGFNGGACIATQDIKDFFALEDGKYGSAILSNSQIKMVLQLTANEAEYVQKELKLNRNELREIKQYERGQVLVCANTNHVPIQIIGSEYETKLITTDPSIVKEVIAEINKNGGL